MKWSRFYWFKLDNYDENTVGSPVGTSDYASIVTFDSNMLGVADTYKLVSEYFCNKLHHLVYLSELMKVYLRVDFFKLI